MLLATSLSAQKAAAPLRWYKGNTHTHTINSDGDSTPEEVVRWYREHGYQFLVLTDHNFLTSVEGLSALHAADEKFLIIPGEEVTDRFGDKPIHVNGLNLKRLIEPQGGKNVADTIQRNVDAVRGAQAVPHINHPNYEWAISVDDLKQIRNNRLFEIYNGHPLTNSNGGGDKPGLEEVWDILLTSGKVIYGIAVDDAHHFKRPWDRDASRPGRGWVVVRARALNTMTLMEALERGDFYASTGVALTDYTVATDAVTVTITPNGATKFITTFTGKGGRMLERTGANPAIYKLRGNEQYVRARVVDSNGNIAWTQPVFAAKPPSAP